MSEYITSQPEETHMPKKSILATIKYKTTTRDGLIGDFDFKSLCLPSFPYGGKSGPRKPAPFYGLEDDLPTVVALVAGFQHALAMVAGLITPPIIFSSALALPAATQSYMISASLIASGILSCIQMSKVRIPKTNYYIGTGLITVVGTSFATLSTGFAIFNALYADGTCSSTTVNGVTTRNACPDAYGALLGTCILCSLLEMGMSFVPAKKLRKIFPPIVTGTVVVLIGASLISHSGVLNWGGGSGGCHARPVAPSIFRLCPTIFAPKPLPWGDPRLIGLGFLSFVTIVITEIFGSPFMRNASIIVGLIVGSIVAGATGYWDVSSIKSSPAITFLWVKTFKLTIYGPAILPAMAVYIALAMEAIGDITASSEASRVEVDGPVFDSRIQGGVLADGIAGMLSGLFTVTPMSIFAQNNGVIVITRCANRRAGYACAGWLILFGVLGKLSGVFLSIPSSVLGGVTTFLFATVAVSGIRVLSYITWRRKERFVLGASMMFGLGNLLVEDWYTHLFDEVSTTNKGLAGFLSSITIILSTPYLIAGIIGILLWHILPDEAPDHAVVMVEEEQERVELGQLGKHDKAGSSSEDGEEIKGIMPATRVEPVK